MVLAKKGHHTDTVVLHCYTSWSLRYPGELQWHFGELLLFMWATPAEVIGSALVKMLLAMKAA